MSQKITIGPDPLLIIWFSHDFQILVKEKSCNITLVCSVPIVPVLIRI